MTERRASAGEACDLRHAPIERRDVLRAGAWLALGPALSARRRSGHGSTEGQPNVLVVIGGDLGWRDVAPHVHTPNLALLMKRGRVHRNAFVYPTGPLTSYAFLFGRYPRRDGIVESPSYYEEEGSRVPNPSPALESLPKVMKRAGYATGLFGKWNLGGVDGGERARAPALHGYDTWRAGVPGILSRGGGSGYTDWFRVDDGVESMSTEYQTSALGAACEDWWKATSGPKLAVCAFAAAHAPFHEPPAELVREPPTPIKRSPRWPARVQYEAMVQSLDTVLGRMLARVGEDTLVLFFTDNGTPIQAAAFDQNPRRVKHSTFDGGIHVPLVIAGPGVAAGETNALVSCVDLAPTLARFVGADLPPEAFPDAQPFATPGALETSRRKFVYADANDEEYMVRTKTHKLRLVREERRLVQELYHMRHDPDEDHPMALDDELNAALGDELRALLAGAVDPPPRDGPARTEDESGERAGPRDDD